MVNAELFQITVNFSTAITNYITRFINPDRRMLSTPRSTRRISRRVGSLIACIDWQRGIQMFYLGRRLNRRGIKHTLPRRRIGVEIHRIRRCVHNQPTHVANCLYDLLHLFDHGVESFDRSAAPVAIPNIAKQERGFLRRPLARDILHLPYGVAPFILDESLTTLI